MTGKEWEKKKKKSAGRHRSENEKV